jgi:hypothetical protein
MQSSRMTYHFLLTFTYKHENISPQWAWWMYVHRNICPTPERALAHLQWLHLVRFKWSGWSCRSLQRIHRLLNLNLDCGEKFTSVYQYSVSDDGIPSDDEILSRTICFICDTLPIASFIFIILITNKRDYLFIHPWFI